MLDDTIKITKHEASMASFACAQYAETIEFMLGKLLGEEIEAHNMDCLDGDEIDPEIKPIVENAIAFKQIAKSMATKVASKNIRAVEAERERRRIRESCTGEDCDPCPVEDCELRPS